MSQIIKVVEVVKAVQRRPEPQRPEVTFFSEDDVWVFDIEAVRSEGEGPCELCATALEIEQFRGNNLRMNFPKLVILDRDTIGGPEPDGGGLVHPHCRCLLNRLLF